MNKKENEFAIKWKKELNQIHYDPSAKKQGNGSKEKPFNNIKDLKLRPGDELLIKSGLPGHFKNNINNFIKDEKDYSNILYVFLAVAIALTYFSWVSAKTDQYAEMWSKRIEACHQIGGDMNNKGECVGEIIK